MHTTMKRFAATVCGALAVLAVALGGASTASAAGPNYLEPGQSAAYPTWVWGYTRICAYNYGDEPGWVEVYKYANWYASGYWVTAFSPGPHATTCESVAGNGASIRAFNRGVTAISTYTQ